MSKSQRSRYTMTSRNRFIPLGKGITSKSLRFYFQITRIVTNRGTSSGPS